jgi:hypothetical protein
MAVVKESARPGAHCRWARRVACERCRPAVGYLSGEIHRLHDRSGACVDRGVSPFDLNHARAGLQAERDAAHELLVTAIRATRYANPDGDVPVREELIAGYPVAVLTEKGRNARKRLDENGKPESTSSPLTCSAGHDDAA